MNTNGNKGSAGRGLPLHLDDPPNSELPGVPLSEPSDTSANSAIRGGPATDPFAAFATRAGIKGTDGIDKKQLALLGGGLAIAVLFFVFTAVVGRSPKKQMAREEPSQTTKQNDSQQPKSSLTPVMESVRTPAPDNANGQLSPSDIRRTRSSGGGGAASVNSPVGQKPSPGKSTTVGSLGNVPSFADTQQKWEEPRPYGESAPPSPWQSQQQQNALKEPSLIFVRNQVQNHMAVSPRTTADGDGTPLLQMTPGSRIQAKLETRISSAVQAPVVAVVEYTYAVGDRTIVPAGARVYGQLQQADQSGFVSVKFDEIELLDGAREKIDAIGTGLDLGPIKGNVYGKNTGKNFLVQAASGIGSVFAEIAGNNNSAAFSESDMLRERVAQNIGTAGDSEVMNLNVNSRVVVSVPADTKIYIVFTKHEERSSALHKVAAATP